MSDSDRPVMDSAGIDELSEYRAVSRLAIGAFLLSLLSVVGFGNPLLWIVPLASLVLSVYALRAVAASENLSGGKLAGLALLLSLFVLTAAPTRYFTVRSLLFSQARTHADQWLRMVQQQQLTEAHELHLDYYERQAEDVDLEEFYSRQPDLGPMNDNMPKMMIDSPGASLDDFFQTEPLKFVVEHGEQAKIRFLENVQIVSKGGEFGLDSVTLRYELTYQQDGETVITPFLLRMDRERYSKLREFHWRVGQINLERLVS